VISIQSAISGAIAQDEILMIVQFKVEKQLELWLPNSLNYFTLQSTVT